MRTSGWGRSGSGGDGGVQSAGSRDKSFLRHPQQNFPEEDQAGKGAPTENGESLRQSIVLEEL